MEDVVLTLPQALEVLAILSAIPVVILALWLDYFERLVAESELPPQGEEGPDPVARMLQQVKFSGMVSLLFQFALFLGTAEIRTQAPLTAYGLFVAALFAQITLQTRTERRILGRFAAHSKGRSYQAEAQRASTVGGLMRRGFVVGVGAALLYVAILYFSVQTSVWMAGALQLSKVAGLLVMLAGGLTGVVLGLGVNFAMGPVYMRRVMPCREEKDGDLHALVAGIFSSAGLRMPRVYRVETPQLPFANAFMTGFASLRGPLGPALFVSQGLLESLNDQEVSAILAHEVSHLAMRHLRRRFLYAVSLIVGSTLISTALVTFTQIMTGDQRAAIGTGYAVGLLCFVTAMRMLSRQSQQHELDADFGAVRDFGAGFDALARALEKLDQVNQAPVGKTLPTHPSTRKRIERLAVRLAQEPGRAGVPAAARPAGKRDGDLAA